MGLVFNRLHCLIGLIFSSEHYTYCVHWHCYLFTFLPPSPPGNIHIVPLFSKRGVFSGTVWSGITPLGATAQGGGYWAGRRGGL
ncbi:uncharacterized protein P884DRAFT_5510 [Thermothelomyces heterothallicus CBS 202.75]|uniref:uncharacterized protein n=1 Tax=Thermothelomyces heterothallicus CBS 202.75 TaxID=1149848 RepID=UPI0037428FDD